jgi:hypothetical protein
MVRKKTGSVERAKGSIVQARVSPVIRKLLEEAALGNKRKLSREIEERLEFTLARPLRKDRLSEPARITALSDAVALTARWIETVTGRRWNEDRYTAQHLATAIGRVIHRLIIEDMPLGEVTIPPKVTERAKTVRSVDSKTYIDRLGEVEADLVVASIMLAPEPQIPYVPYTQVFMEYWRIRRDLKPGRQK